MAPLIGFAGPLLFILIYLLINGSLLSTKAKVLHSILIYMLSVATGIGLTILNGAGSIFAGVIAPIFYVIIFTIIARSQKRQESEN